MRRWREAGSRAALPLVIARRLPLKFRQRWPGARMEKDAHGIPCPTDTPAIDPMTALVPVNGFDDDGCRPGYGGGYFDCTLAACDLVR